jgi:hypothetical protein
MSEQTGTRSVTHQYPQSIKGHASVAIAVLAKYTPQSPPQTMQPATSTRYPPTQLLHTATHNSNTGHPTKV